MVFEWLHPKYLALLPAIARVCDEPAVMTPLLRTVHELASNRCTRIGFDPKSAHGIRLFQLASQVRGRGTGTGRVVRCV